MKKWIRQHPSSALTLALYAGALALFLAVHGAGYAQNRAGVAGGALAPVALSPSDFSFEGLEARGENEWVCTDDDPKMILLDSGRKASAVTLDIAYSLPPGPVNVFWAEGGQAHGIRRMAYAQDAGGSVFYLPAGGAAGLRIDPGVVAGNVLTIRRIALNDARPVWSFFVPGAGEAALLAVLPGLCACGLCALREAGAGARPAPGRKRAGDARG